MAAELPVATASIVPVSIVKWIANVCVKNNNTNVRNQRKTSLVYSLFFFFFSYVYIVERENKFTAIYS